MSDTFSFKNLETNTNISFELDKPFIIVFGKNGSGKTTLSRNAPDKECVFNTDFIHKTIYVETSDGANDDAKTKESFSELWIGEKIVRLKTELDEIKKTKASINKIKEETVAAISKAFNDKGIQIIKLTDIDKRISSLPFERSKDKTDEEIISNYKTSLSYETTIKDDEQLNQSIIRTKNNELVQLFIKNIKTSPLLEEILLLKTKTEKTGLLSLVSRYNSICEEVKRIDSCFQASDANKEEEWIKLGLELHKDSNTCFFCGKENIKDAKDKWKEIMTSKLKEEVAQIINHIEKTTKIIENILKDKDHFAKIANKSIKTIENINSYLSSIKSIMVTRKKIGEDVVFPIIERDDLVLEESKLLENIQNYIFASFSSKYEILNLLINHYDKNASLKDKEIEEEMNNDAKEIKKSINKHLSELDFDKELKINIERRGVDKKYRFGFVNSSTKISTLSDGQKHKLALAIFFASIEKMNLNDKVVILDDPIVTLDYRSYYSVKTIIINLRKNKEPKNVIVLTCNIDYLFIQLFNLFNNSAVNDTKLLHLFGNGINEIDFNIINYDDLSLYQNGIMQLKTFEEYSLIAFLNIRIYRMFLDLYLRMHGYPSNGNPKDEINLISDLSLEDKTILLNNNLYLEKHCRDINATNEELYVTFDKTNEFVKILGFPKIINDINDTKLKTFSNKNKRETSYSGDDLLFLIINRAISVMNSTNEKYKYLKKYLNHPRTQLTSSIVGVDFSDLEIKDL